MFLIVLCVIIGLVGIIVPIVIRKIGTYPLWLGITVVTLGFVLLAGGVSLMSEHQLEKNIASLKTVHVMPLEIRHDYRDQVLTIYGEFRQPYDVKIGEVDMKSAYMTDPKNSRGVLMCQLPKKPRLKSGEYLGLVMSGKPLAKFKFKVSDDPMAPRKALVVGDKLLSLAIWLIAVFALVAIGMSFYKAMQARAKEEDDQQGQQQGGAGPPAVNP